MWIERLDIDGFGRLAGGFVFGSGLSVVTGPNEAGKTTLQEALVRTIFGFTPRERRRYGAQSLAVKDRFAPWNRPQFGLVARLRDVDGNSLRVEWEFDEHVVTLRNADTGEDLSTDVRRAKGDVSLGQFLLGLEYNDYCQVCRLDQTTVKAVERSDSLVNALQEAVESIGSDVRVADADDRLSAFLSSQVGVHNGHYGPLRGKPLDRAMAERERLTDDLAACERARDEIAELTRNMAVSRRQVTIFEDQLEQRRQQLLRARATEAVRTLRRAHQLAAAIADAPTQDDTPKPPAVADRVKIAFEQWSAASRALASARTQAATAEPRLTELRAEERKLQQRADGLAAYRDVDATAESAISTLRGRLLAEREETPSQVPPLPDRDPALARYRERRGELLAEASRSATNYRGSVLAIAGALAVLSIAGGVIVHPAVFLGALAAAVLVMLAGRTRASPGDLASEFGAASLEELEQRAIAEDKAVAAAMAAADQAHSRAAERRRRVEQARHELADHLRLVGFEPADDIEESISAYLTACERAAELRQTEALLAHRRAALVAEAEAERDVRIRKDELQDAEREVRSALQTCGIEEAELQTARAAFDAALRASAAAAERLESTARTRVALDEVLDGRSMDQLQDEADGAAQRLREHVAVHGELPASADDQSTLESAIRELASRLRQAERELADYEARIEERERNLPEPSELKVSLAACSHRIDQLELARDAVRLARTTLAEAARDAHRAFAPFLNEALEKNLPRITGGRYREVTVNDDLGLTLVAPETGRQVPAESLSRGTQDQLFLVQRLELARMLDPTKGAAPLLLDDPFARCDPERVRLALAILGEMAAERQIIVFSEDPHLAEVAREVCTSCHVIELAAPTERAPDPEVVL